MTRRLHIGRNSLYKIVSSKDALIKSVIEYKTTLFAETEEKILSGADDTDTKIKKFCNCTPTPSGQWATTSGTTCRACIPTFFSYKEATDAVGDLVLYGLKAR